MNNYLLGLSKTELTELLQNERKKFIRAIDHGSPASHLEAIREIIRSIEAALAQKESTTNPPGQIAGPQHKLR